MSKVLITGATGFIGNHVTRLCLEKGDEVRVMVMPGEDRSPLDGMDVEFVEGNLLDGDSLRKAVTGVEQLYHLAAMFAIWTKDPDLHYKINVDGARMMMEAALAAERAAHARAIQNKDAMIADLRLQLHHWPNVLRGEGDIRLGRN